jgi:hypothetical protein
MQSKEPDWADRFHGHLDRCERCRTQPFDLCPAGQSLLGQAAEMLERQRTKWNE